MNALTAYLPQSQGYLPYWMLFVSGLAVFNSAQNYLTTKLTSRVYSKSAVSGLTSRLFGLWTLMSAAIRLTAAYNIHNKQMYGLALFSYVVVVGHYLSEWLVFKTSSFAGPLASPLIVGTTSLIWMINQYSYYVSP